MGIYFRIEKRNGFGFVVIRFNAFGRGFFLYLPKIEIIKWQKNMKTKKAKYHPIEPTVETLKEFESISMVCRSDLRVEIIWTTLNCMKKNPKLSICEAIECGIGEWEK